MAKHLVLKGFVLRPVALAVDIDAGTAEPVMLGEQEMSLDELAVFAEQQWPLMWVTLRQQFADQAAPAAAEPNRAECRKAVNGKKAPAPA